MKKRSLQILVLFILIFTSCKDEFSNFEDGIYANIETNKGKIIVQLYPEEVPLTVANFITLAEGTNPKVSDTLKGKKFYDGLTFHRVIKDFMIQGGDPMGNGQGGPGYKFYDEFINTINTIPNSGGGIYFLSVMVPGCGKIRHKRFKNIKEEGWKQSKLLDDTWGTHSIYFTKKGIDNVYNYLQKNKIDQPIDHWLRYKFKCWHYTNNVNEDGFFMGLFEQYNTFCESRINTLDN